MTFRNEHLSYSRTQRFAECPLSFKLHYIDKAPSTPGVPLRFGKAVHQTLEALVKEHVAQGNIARLSSDRAIQIWQDVFAKEELSGIDVFTEGMDILKSFAWTEGVVNPSDVIGIETTFELTIGRFKVVGAIDRVDQVDDFVIRIRDYKTNRILFTREEVDESVQLSLYAMAAQKLWPWARTIELQFDMLRHDVQMRTTRTPEQLATAADYFVAMGERSESGTYPAKPNTNCVYCDHRASCHAYAFALAGKQEIVASDLEDLERVAQEREEVTRIAKIAYARKAELEAILKARLAQTEALELAGRRYSISNSSTSEYPLYETAKTIAEATGVDRDIVVSEIASVDATALKATLKQLLEDLPRDKFTMMRAEIEARAKRTLTPRFNVKEVRS